MECLRVNHTNPLHVKADFTISILIPLFHLRAPPPRSLHVFFYAGGSAAFGMRVRALDVADGSRQRPARRPSLLFPAFSSSNNGVKGEKVKVFTGHSVIFVLWAAPSPGLGFTTLGPRSRPPPLHPPLVFHPSVCLAPSLPRRPVLSPDSQVCEELGLPSSPPPPPPRRWDARMLACVRALPPFALSHMVNKFSLHN